jgi:hypothetical protein
MRPQIVQERVAGLRLNGPKVRSPAAGVRPLVPISIGLLKAKQELVGVTADRWVEHIFGVIVGLVCEN